MELKNLGDNAKYIIDEIYKESKNHKEDVGIMSSLLKINKYAENIDLLSDENYNIYYKVDLSTMIKNNLEDSNLFEFFSQGWDLSEDKKCLIKKI
jgi:glutamine cyclotransferase